MVVTTGGRSRHEPPVRRLFSPNHARAPVSGASMMSIENVRTIRGMAASICIANTDTGENAPNAATAAGAAIAGCGPVHSCPRMNGSRTTVTPSASSCRSAPSSEIVTTTTRCPAAARDLDHCTVYVPIPPPKNGGNSQDIRHTFTTAIVTRRRSPDAIRPSVCPMRPRPPARSRRPIQAQTDLVPPIGSFWPRPLVFLHIPKAAGSTLQELIVRQYANARYYRFTGDTRQWRDFPTLPEDERALYDRSEERRVGKECR